MRHDATANLGAWRDGLIGVVIFSGSLPATRVAVGGFAPVFLTSARAAVAAALGAMCLYLLRQPRPARGDLAPLAVTALGVVVGFPLLTALALQHVTSARSVVFIGLLPLATAAFGVLRAGERPRPVFWGFALAGAATVAGFALARGGGSGDLPGDLLMVAAVLVCGLGYAEGARLSRRLGGWQTISWALLLAAPLMAPLAATQAPANWSAIGAGAWIGLAYVSVFSMFLGFWFWYRGLARGGVAAVGQLQLIQPFLSLILAGWLLHEQVSLGMIATTGLVVACVVGARRSA